MRKVQKNRVPQGHRLLPINGVLTAVPVSAVSTWQATQHNAGYGAGVTAHAVWLPFELTIDAGRSVVNSVAASQFGQSFQLGWHDVGAWKGSVQTLLEVRKMPEAQQRAMLIATVEEGPQQRVWANIVSKMTPFQVSRELADRMTPNPWIDESMTYGNTPDVYEDTPQQAAEKARQTKATPYSGTLDESKVIPGAIAN